MSRNEHTPIERDHPLLVEHYSDILAMFPDAQFAMDGDIVRFRRKPLVRWLADNVDLNKLCHAAHLGRFSLAEYMTFYQDMGYSLSGFTDIFAVQLDEMESRGATFNDLGDTLISDWGDQ